MNLLFSIPFLKRKNLPRQVISTQWKERDEILESDVNLFCWERPVNESIQTYLERLMEKELQPIKFHSSIQDLSENIETFKATWDQEVNKAADLFWKDVEEIVKDFLSYSDIQSGTVHLKIVDNNGCTKFHTDSYTLRLFTTYYGRGTEWLPEKATDRRGLGKKNELIVRNPDQIQRMRPFEVGILKGEPSHIKSVRGIVHKSPEIMECNEKRIILRVDI